MGADKRNADPYDGDSKEKQSQHSIVAQGFHFWQPIVFYTVYK